MASQDLATRTTTSRAASTITSTAADWQTTRKTRSPRWARGSPGVRAGWATERSLGGAAMVLILGPFDLFADLDLLEFLLHPLDQFLGEAGIVEGLGVFLPF